MKQYIRYFLYGLLIFFTLLLWDAWQLEHKPQQAPVNAKDNVTAPTNTGTYAPPVTGLKHVNSRIKSIAKHVTQTANHHLILVKTHVLDIKIDTVGGNIVQANLLNYPKTLKNKQPIELFNNNPDTLYVAQSGLFSTTNHEQLQYTASQNKYETKNGNTPLQVVLKAKTANGLTVEKIYTFKPNDYAIQLTFNVQNETTKPWTGSYFTQFTRNSHAGGHAHFLHAYSFFGAALSSSKDPYQKIKLDKLSTDPISKNIANGWLAMIQHYFVGAWVPSRNVTYHYYSNRTADGICTVGMVSPEVTVQGNQSTQFTSTLYVGPKITSLLKQVAPHLELTVDYGHLWIIAIVIFKLLQLVNRFIGNWGWSIVIITILIKLVFYKLSEASYRSMANMRKLQPKINKLKEQYGKDKQAISRAMMELYKKEKINPLGGCLPIIIQIPVFFALYVVLLESVELRQAPFIFWIHDLAVKDPYYILPVIMGISMYFQQKLTPTPAADPTQAKMMTLMPIFMTVLFLSFPAGLVLYWLVNNVLSILQQWYIIKRVDRGDFDKKKKKPSKIGVLLKNAGRKKRY